MARKPVDGTVYLGVDPSLVSSGVALLWPPDEEHEFESMESTVLSVEEIGSWLDGLDCCSAPQVVLGIEIPAKGKGRRGGHTFSMKSVRSAVTAWKRAVKSRAPRRNRIVDIDVDEWREYVYGPGSTKRAAPTKDYWKERAVQQVRGMVEGVANHNEAEAILILDYLTNHYR